MRFHDMAQTSVKIIYDGDCPFCKTYARLYKIRESVGELILINARENPGISKQLLNEGFNLDDGFVVEVNDAKYHGDEAIYKLALMGTSSSFFNRINIRLFSNKKLSKIIYPILRLGRNLILKITNKKLIHE